MEKEYKTEQEGFWAGNFGEDYIERNQGDKLLAANLNFFNNAFKNINGAKSVLEFGANIGMNLKALKLLYPEMALNAVEINKKACSILKEVIGSKNVTNDSIFNFSTKKKVDISLIKGVLIHINPDMLQIVYQKLYDISLKYIFIAEYYNPTPVTINYRGHKDRLFKRDFAGEMLEKFPSLELIDYGFAYRNDNNFPKDDITWFLLKKN